MLVLKEGAKLELILLKESEELLSFVVFLRGLDLKELRLLGRKRLLDLFLGDVAY